MAATKIDEQPVYSLLEIADKDDIVAQQQQQHQQAHQQQTNPHVHVVRSQHQQQLPLAKDEGPVNLTPSSSVPFQSTSVKVDNDAAASSSISTKVDATNAFQQAFQNAFQQGSLTSPFTSSAFQSMQANPNAAFQPNVAFQTGSDIFSNNPPRNTLDPATLQAAAAQSRLIDPKLAATIPQDPQSKVTINPTQPSLSSSMSALSANTAAATANGTTTATSQTSTGSTFTYDERFHILYEREIRWTEVRKYSEFIRRFATEASHMEITKENYYDLYNMALCLLKSVDSLDPDKLNRKTNEYAFMNAQMAGQPGMSTTALISTPMGVQQQPAQAVTDMELMQRKNQFDMFINRQTSAFDGTTYLSTIPKYAAIPTPTGEQAIYAYNQTTSEGVPVGAYAVPINAATASFQGQAFMKAATTADPLKQGRNYTGEVFFDDLNNQGDNQRPKRRRRRTVYSSRRNLHCHMCGVTETPEWRRGPAGDHTLCNACGLHYAKSLKKQRKERESRKHSIDMLLNEQQTQPGVATPSSSVTTTVATPSPTETPPPISQTIDTIASPPATEV
jgi:hypothetical protein